MGPMPTVFIALDQRGAVLSTPNERIGHDAPNLNPAEMGSGIQNLGVDVGEEAVTERPPEVLAHMHDDHKLGRDADCAVQLMGVYQSHDNILSVNSYQFWRQILRTQCPGLPPLSSISQESWQMLQRTRSQQMLKRVQQVGLVVSKPFLMTSLRLTKSAHNPFL